MVDDGVLFRESQIPQSQSVRYSALLTQDPEDWDLGFLVCAWDIHCQSTSASKYSAPVTIHFI